MLRASLTASIMKRRPLLPLCLLVISTGSTAACSFDGGGLDGSDAGVAEDAAPPAADAGMADALDRDRDDDGVADDADNCPDAANFSQDDEDSDGVGDVCDNCPHVVNPGQNDVGEINAGGQPDGVGDACDPRPSGEGDSIAFFEGFNGDLSAWTVYSGDWVITDGALVQNDVQRAFRHIAWNKGAAQSFNRVALHATIAAEPTPPGDPSLQRGAGILAAFGELPNGDDVGYVCAQVASTQLGGQPSAYVAASELSGAGFNENDTGRAPWLVTPNERYFYKFSLDLTEQQQICSVRKQGVAMPVVVDGKDDSIQTAGFVGFQTFGASARFEHLVVFSLGGELDP